MFPFYKSLREDGKGKPFTSSLDPPPGPPTDDKDNFIPMSQWDPDNWPPHIHEPRKTKPKGEEK